MEHQGHRIEIHDAGHSGHHKSNRKPMRTFLTELGKFLLIFGFFFGISATVIMWPNLITVVNYYFHTGKSDNSNLPVASNDYASIAPTLQQKTITQDTKIIIPKINVDAPIILTDSTANKDILEVLKNGVAHLAGTALPGHIGNMFITGHSSYYWWSGGKYNQVFALLGKLSVNDLIYVYYQGGEFVYKVTESITVLPSQIEVLKTTTTPTLSLMTCVPVGTNLKRLVVKADLISTPPINVDQLNQFTDIPKLPTILPL